MGWIKLLSKRMMFFRADDTRTRTYSAGFVILRSLQDGSQSNFPATATNPSRLATYDPHHFYGYLMAIPTIYNRTLDCVEYQKANNIAYSAVWASKLRLVGEPPDIRSFDNIIEAAELEWCMNNPLGSRLGSSLT